MEDIAKGAINFNSTNSFPAMFGDTMGLNTQRRIILELPTTLADLFEYFSSCDLALVESIMEDGAREEPENLEKVSDIVLDYLNVIDIMQLRMACKSTAQIASAQAIKKSIQAGNLDDSIRINYWVTRTPFFEVVNELKRLYPPLSIFTNVFEEILNRIKESPPDSKLQH